MKKNNLKLPNWVIKKIKNGKEGEAGSISVAIVFYSLALVVGFLTYNPFGVSLILKIIFAVLIFAVSFIAAIWFYNQVMILEDLRKSEKFKTSKTSTN